jgi:hypothetical protein
MREEGYYQIKYHGIWMIAKLHPDEIPENDSWYLCGDENIYERHEFDEIGSKIQLLS